MDASQKLDVIIASGRFAMIQDKTKYTPEEYLAREEKAEYKSEYHDGEIRMMSGGTPEHSSIAVNVIITLGSALAGGPCRVFNSDMRLLVAPRGDYTYPDVMVVCGKLELQPGRRDVVTNPTVLFEILSASTREYDRIEKFRLYKEIETLREYVLVDSERVVVSVLRREMETGKWTIEILNDLHDVLILESLNLEIPLSHIYTGIDFQTNPESNAE